MDMVTCIMKHIQLAYGKPVEMLLQLNKHFSQNYGNPSRHTLLLTSCERSILSKSSLHHAIEQGVHYPLISIT